MHYNLSQCNAIEVFHIDKEHLTSFLIIIMLLNCIELNGPIDFFQLNVFILKIK